MAKQSKMTRLGHEVQSSDRHCPKCNGVVKAQYKMVTRKPGSCDFRQKPKTIFVCNKCHEEFKKKDL